MKIFLVGLFVLGVVSLGNTLKCYHCGGPLKSDCAKGVISAMKIKDCSKEPVANSFILDDKKSLNGKELADKEPQLKQTFATATCVTVTTAKAVTRGCSFFTGTVDPCEAIKEATRPKSCKSCATDLCNTDINP